MMHVESMQWPTTLAYVSGPHFSPVVWTSWSSASPIRQCGFPCYEIGSCIMRVTWHWVNCGRRYSGIWSWKSIWPLPSLSKIMSFLYCLFLNSKIQGIVLATDAIICLRFSEVKFYSSNIKRCYSDSVWGGEGSWHIKNDKMYFLGQLIYNSFLIWKCIRILPLHN